jgi:hypothetical protein
MYKRNRQDEGVEYPTRADREMSFIEPFIGLAEWQALDGGRKRAAHGDWVSKPRIKVLRGVTHPTWTEIVNEDTMRASFILRITGLWPLHRYYLARKLNTMALVASANFAQRRNGIGI